MQWFRKKGGLMDTQKDNSGNNCIVTRLQNVRPHSNADRLKLATVLGAQVIVGLESKDDDLVVYFDSNLRLSNQYLHVNNLYSNPELNIDKDVKGYFGRNGRVRAQKFRGEISNGYVADLYSLSACMDIYDEEMFQEGMEFTHINGVKICEKYVVPTKHIQGQSRKIISDMFHRHWDTKQLMREIESIPDGASCWIEEKIHGTSGRTGHVLCKTNKKWWRFWKPKEEWKVVSGTRRVDNINCHISDTRQEIERRVAPHLHKGEEIYYEIYGYDGGKCIQAGFPYDCRGGEWKAMLYRVTITTPDGFCIDLDREDVYRRAEELGLEKPYHITEGVITRWFSDLDKTNIQNITFFAAGQSRLDIGTLCEGVVIWFKNHYNKWQALKYKSEEFLIDQDKRIENEQGDVEDSL